MARVVFRIVLFVGAIVGDAPDDFFGIMASCEGTLRVGAIALGLQILPDFLLVVCSYFPRFGE
ncbi:MAG: hypothetical protein ACRD5M_10205 [Candidatus Acidiferrales bacterium]